MKTTVEITDDLLLTAKQVAAEEHNTLRGLIEEGLRHVLEQRRDERPFRLRSAGFDGQGLQPGIREGDWDQLRELIYGGAGG
jgi:hypothetical protein